MDFLVKPSTFSVAEIPDDILTHKYKTEKHTLAGLKRLQTKPVEVEEKLCPRRWRLEGHGRRLECPPKTNTDTNTNRTTQHVVPGALSCGHGGLLLPPPPPPQAHPQVVSVEN